MKQKDQRKKGVSLYRFRGGIPRILLYQLLSKGVFAAVMSLYRQLTGLLFWNVDRPAFTSGDLPYLLRTWQGWVLVCLGFAALVLYTVFDVNATILLSDRLLHGRPIRVLPLLREAFGSLKQFRSVPGALAVLYVSLAAPLTGAAFGISLTTDFTVPEFIDSFIRENPALNLLYTAVLVVLGLVGFVCLFTFHFVLLGKLDVPEAMKASRAVMKRNWHRFLARYLAFLLRSLGLAAVLAFAVYVVPAVLLQVLPLSTYAYHTGVVFFTLLFAIVLSLFTLLLLYFSMMKLTILYEEFSGDPEAEYTPPRSSRHLGFAAVCLLALAGLFLLSLGAAADFDGLFPALKDVKVIAHRGGGTLANENTVLSLEAAIDRGAYASEIDVQRTKDGHYIINHDADFSRCCGDSRRPGEMTLAEVKELRVVNAQNPLAPTTEVATIEEMLEAAKGRIKLYIELKGASADEQMAEDLYAMLAERDMLGEAMLISLDYALIDYIETWHPEAETGYLCYFAFGELENMHCDAMLLEAETATQANIEKIHAAGKEVNVWTVNTLTAMTSFLGSDADGIITDEVAQADAVREVLLGRSDEARVLAAVFP